MVISIKSWGGQPGHPYAIEQRRDDGRQMAQSWQNGKANRHA
jgi:hypothetical protein